MFHTAHPVQFFAGQDVRLKVIGFAVPDRVPNRERIGQVLTCESLAARDRRKEFLVNHTQQRFR